MAKYFIPTGKRDRETEKGRSIQKLTYTTDLIGPGKASKIKSVFRQKCFYETWRRVYVLIRLLDQNEKCLWFTYPTGQESK